MLNYVNSGDDLQIALGAGETVTSGLLYQIGGGLFGVAKNDADGDNGESAVYLRKGRVELTLTAGEEASEGDPAFFDAAINGISAVAVGPKVGYFTDGLSASDTKAEIVLITDCDGSPFQTVVAKLDASSGLAIGTTLFGPTLPDGVVIVDAAIHVATTFTSATDAATIALGIETDDASGLAAAVAISDASNPWDEGTSPSDVDGTDYSAQTQATRRLVATVAVEALTDGVLYVIAKFVKVP